MHSSTARRVLTACVVAALAVAALVAPGVASAKKSSTSHCLGDNITGQGSSLQKGAQQTLWDKGFNGTPATASKFSCTKVGEEPTITYTSDGSGAGMKSWAAEGTFESEYEAGKFATTGFADDNAFVATDEPPNATQISNIENQESTPTTKSLLTVPVAQESVAVIVHLPAGCSATSTAATGRLSLTDKALQGIFAGTVTTWGGLDGEGGNVISGTGCTADPIHVVVRQDSSGTTHIFKQFLGQINPGTLTTSEGSETWQQLSEGSLNTEWPTAANVTPAGGNGGSALATKVLATEGGIGYINLFEGRAKGFAPATSTTFWTKIQNAVKGKTTTFSDPSTGAEDTTATAQDANCNKIVYVDEKGSPFPPPAASSPWDSVTTSITQKTYALCGLTYDLAFTKYSLLSGTSAKEEETVKEFEQFVIDKKGGQSQLAGHDYLSLPKGAVDSEAISGAAEIGF